MAPSFFSLPLELRVQVYRCLLCHSSWMQPQRIESPEYRFAINPAERALPSSEPQVGRAFSLESAILQTCRTVYSEAIPVLYGETTFLYSCWTSRFNMDNYPRTRLPDVNLKHTKHLKLDVEEDLRFENIAVKSVAVRIRYFIKRGCDLRTFELSSGKLRTWYEDDTGECILPKAIAASQEVQTALVDLKVSNTLTIAIWYHDAVDHERQKSLNDDFHSFVNQLTSDKGMTVTKQESKVVYKFTPEDGAEDDSEREQEEYNDDDKVLASNKLSWCLRPQLSEQQSPRTASASD